MKNLQRVMTTQTPQSQQQQTLKIQDKLLAAQKRLGVAERELEWISDIDPALLSDQGRFDYSGIIEDIRGEFEMVLGLVLEAVGEKRTDA
jgi:hypothetical protein